MLQHKRQHIQIIIERRVSQSLSNHIGQMVRKQIQMDDTFLHENLIITRLVLKNLLYNIATPSQLISHRVIKHKLFVFFGNVFENLFNMERKLHPSGFSTDTLLDLSVDAAHDCTNEGLTTLQMDRSRVR